MGYLCSKHCRNSVEDFPLNMNVDEYFVRGDDNGAHL